jgi:lipopolysaccharide export system protein LptC
MSPRRIAKALAGFGAIALIALLGVAIWVVHSRDTAAAIRKVAGLVPGTLLHARNFHWTQMKAGQREWVLTARDASYAADKSSMTLIDANLSMVSEDGKQVNVTAPHAVLFMDGNHVHRADLSGGTIIKYGNFVLTTDAASFMPDEDKVEAPGAVTLEGEGVTVTGVGLTGNPKTQVFNLLQQVRTKFNPKKASANSKKS